MNSDLPPPVLIRRLAAIMYDSLLLCGVLFMAGVPLLLIPDGVRGGSWTIELVIQLYLVLVCLIFFGWFWTHGGQTLGMRAWRLRVVHSSGSSIGWRSASIRFFSAILSWTILGMGFWWSIFDREKLAWHDHLSGTKLIRLPKT